MSETAEHPAGWYPAPGDSTQERYWDGSAWTAHFRPTGPPVGGPTSIPATAPSVAVPFYKKRWVQVVGGLIVLAAIFGEPEATTTSPASSNATSQPAPAPAPGAEPAPAPAPEPAPAPAPVPESPRDASLPADQAAFLAVIREYETIYDGATTDLQRANVRNQRRAALCDLIPSRAIAGWVGVVETVGGNSDGDAFVDVEIAPGVNISTWNNSLSDLFDETLIKPGSSLYDFLLGLEEGEQVRFSGTFLSGSDECLRTTNLTEVFDMSRPDFLFRFETIARP